MNQKSFTFILLCLFCCTSCTPHKQEQASISIDEAAMIANSPFIIFFVSSKKLNYSDPISFIKSMHYDRDGKKRDPNFGHAWIHLEGKVEGKRYVLEGGHSGELGIIQPQYLDEVFSRMCKGEKNPISYLWSSQQDGFFQEGSGGHTPTFSFKVKLSQKQFEKVLFWIQHQYPFKEYQIVGYQCTAFVASIAQLVGFPVQYQARIVIPKKIRWLEEDLTLWHDSVFSEITVGSPDVLEESLRNSSNRVF